MMGCSLAPTMVVENNDEMKQFTFFNYFLLCFAMEWRVVPEI
jgi:hypothetical protein